MSTRVVKKKKAIKNGSFKKSKIKELPDKSLDSQKGHDFEKKVALWAKRFFDTDEVQTNFLVNGLTKRAYEVDVYVNRKVGLLRTSDQDIWIECKNVKSTIKRNHILLLKSKMQDVGDACDEGREDFYFDKGVLVSTSQFDSDAIRAADNEDIACVYYNKTTKRFEVTNEPSWVE